MVLNRVKRLIFAYSQNKPLMIVKHVTQLFQTSVTYICVFLKYEPLIDVEAFTLVLTKLGSVSTVISPSFVEYLCLERE